MCHRKHGLYRNPAVKDETDRAEIKSSSNNKSPATAGLLQRRRRDSNPRTGMNR